MSPITLDLPGQPATLQPQAAVEFDTLWHFPFPTILLVDDDEGVRSSLCRVLASQHLNVLSAASGAEAIRLIEQHEPDLLITDLCMDGIDGWKLLFHENRVRPELPIFITTALPARETCGVDLLATAFFQKPLDFDALLGAIRRQLRPAGPSPSNN